LLVELSIRNLAIIDAVTIGFAPGLNVMTGETGAGKSIVVDAVNLALGERADREMIQAGAEKARVEALFDVTGHAAALEALEALGLEAEDGLLPLAREISASGRTLCRVGGSVVPQTTLRQVAEALLDMHGQHEHQSLLDVRRHLAYLDAYGNAEHAAQVVGTRAAYRAWREAARELAKLRERLRERDARLDLLRFQLGELDGAQLRDLYAYAAESLRLNLRGRGFGRRFPDHAAPAVHGRGGKPCPRCGTPIQVRRQGSLARYTYFCPSCQPDPPRT